MFFISSEQSSGIYDKTYLQTLVQSVVVAMAGAMVDRAQVARQLQADGLMQVQWRQFR